MESNQIARSTGSMFRSLEVAAAMVQAWRSDWNVAWRDGGAAG